MMKLHAMLKVHAIPVSKPADGNSGEALECIVGEQIMDDDAGRCDAALSAEVTAHRADESISIHRWFGKMIGICSLGHVACHVNNYIKLVRVCLSKEPVTHHMAHGRMVGGSPDLLTAEPQP